MKTPTHAVLFKNNWDGEGDLEYVFIYYEDGVPIDYNTHKPLLEYVGDEILRGWELTT